MAVVFTAANLDYISLGQPAVLNLLPRTEWTISLWFKTTASAGTGTFISRAESGTRQYQFAIGASAGTNDLECVVGGTFYASGVLVGDTFWHHGVLRSFNNAGTYNAQLYNNGVQAGSNVVSGTTTQVSDTMLGSRHATGNTGTGALFTGSLEDVRVYNRALSLAEIKTIHACKGTDSIMMGLVGRWMLNDYTLGTVASGKTTRDSTENHNDGTPSGTPKGASGFVKYKRRTLFI